MVTRDEVAKLYVATFNRAPDSAGIDWWVSESNFNIEQIAQSFFDQTETQALYPAGTPTSDFVASVYNNLFNRDPDSAGLNYWADELESGRIEKQNFILAVMNGALDSADGNDATVLENKKSVGLYFAQKGLNDKTKAAQVMAHIDDTLDSVSSAYSLIDNYTPSIPNFLQEKQFTLQSTTEQSLSATFVVLNDSVTLEFSSEFGFSEMSINSYTLDSNTNAFTTTSMRGQDVVTYTFPDNHLDIGDRGTVIADGNDGFIITSINNNPILRIEQLTTNSYTPERLIADYNEPLKWDDYYYTDVVLAPDASQIVVYKEPFNQIEIIGIDGVMLYTLDM